MKPESQARTSLVFNALALLAAALICVVSYPELAIRIDALIGGTNGSGSSLGYVRDVYILPGALIFLLLSGVALTLAARRGRRQLGITAFVAWLVLIASLVGSVEWYYSVVRKASTLR